MADEDRAEARHLTEDEEGAEEFEVSADDDDLDAAIEEALEAVERRGEPPAGGAGSAEVAGEAAAAPGAATEDEDYGRLQAELASLRDRSVRTLADFENYRKRVARERRDELRYAVFEVLRDLLPVIDNLGRALQSKGPVEDLKTGVELTMKQLQEFLRRHGVEPIPALGEKFDPNLHEAVSRHEDPEVSHPVVSEELQTGYSMYERLLRPAMVTVAMPADGGGADSRAAAPEEATPEEETARE